MSLGKLPRTLIATGAIALGAAAPAGPAEGDYVVVFRDGVNAGSATTELERGQGFRASQRYGTAVRGLAAHLSDVQRDRVSEDPDVDYVAPDRSFQGTGLAPVAA